MLDDKEIWHLYFSREDYEFIQKNFLNFSKNYIKKKKSSFFAEELLK